MFTAVVTHIVEIEDGQLTEFPGNYTDFVIDKEQRLARQEELFQIQQRAIVRMELALKRYQLWVKISDKFASRVRSMQSRLERVDELNQPNLEKRQLGLDLGGWRGSNNVLEFRNIGKSFDFRQILNNTNFLIRHGERVGLVGSNGAGKSVLLRLILNLETQDFGEIIIGPSVKIGYYAQEHETLDFSKTPLEVVRRTGNLTESNAIAFLIRYLFTYQQATIRIDSLSGGERSRLQLALLVLSGANFLLLDEPTNNLDIAAAEVLENALSDFVGTVFVISHDRYFLDRTVNRIFSLENGILKEYIGGYSDFVEQMMRKGT
ncbi:MAG: ATP-binding cassette domain-containing protein [Chloroflexota bacterium]